MSWGHQHFCSSEYAPPPPCLSAVPLAGKYGGFQPVMRAPADFTYTLPDKLSSAAAAPLLCAGEGSSTCQTVQLPKSWSSSRTSVAPPQSVIMLGSMRRSVDGMPCEGLSFGRASCCHVTQHEVNLHRTASCGITPYRMYSTVLCCH
jgi:hypothetical protein